MAAWIPAAIAGIAGLGSSIIGSRTQAIQGRRERRSRMQMAEYAHSKDLEMWHKMNQYNTPEEQMKRFRDAGLNPNLIYGQGTPGQAQQMPQYQAPQMEYKYSPPVDPGSMIQQYQNFRQREEDIDKTKSQIRLQEVLMDLQGARADGIFQENTIRALETTIASQIMKDNLHDLQNIASMRIGTMKASEWLKQADSEIRQWEAGLTRQGINPRDSVALRMLVQTLQTLGFNPTQLMKKYIQR